MAPEETQAQEEVAARGLDELEFVFRSERIFIWQGEKSIPREGFLAGPRKNNLASSAGHGPRLEIDEAGFLRMLHRLNRVFCTENGKRCKKM